MLGFNLSKTVTTQSQADKVTSTINACQLSSHWPSALVLFQQMEDQRLLASLGDGPCKTWWVNQIFDGQIQGVENTSRSHEFLIVELQPNLLANKNHQGPSFPGISPDKIATSGLLSACDAWAVRLLFCWDLIQQKWISLDTIWNSKSFELAETWKQTTQKRGASEACFSSVFGCQLRVTGSKMLRPRTRVVNGSWFWSFYAPWLD